MVSYQYLLVYFSFKASTSGLYTILLKIDTKVEFENKSENGSP